MINYNPKLWLPLIFKLSKVDTLRKLWPLMLLSAFYSAGIAFLELEVFQLAKEHQLNNIGVMHGVLGFVISLLLVFRTNTAYDRWWEGRKLWGGLTNSSRNLAIKLHSFLETENDKEFFRHTIPAFAYALKHHLRENEDYHEIDPVLDLTLNRHLPNQIAGRIVNRIVSLHSKKEISGEQLLMLNEELSSFTEVCGACERIKNTPIPYTYSVFIKKFIVFYVTTLPFGWVNNLGYFIIPVICLILYALASLELIAEEIENPFGTDEDDLPIEQICQNIEKHVKEIL